MKTDHLWLQRLPQQSLQEDQPKNGGDYLIWLDLENIRGKTGFALTHVQLLEYANVWSSYHKLQGHVVVVADHGSLAQAYPYSSSSSPTTPPKPLSTQSDAHASSSDDDDPNNHYKKSIVQENLCVVFSGDRYNKADDLLADWVGTVSHSVIVTADVELQSRCRRSAQSYQILDPTKFLDDVEQQLLLHPSPPSPPSPPPPSHPNGEASTPTSLDSDATNSVLNDESTSNEHTLLKQQIQSGKLDDEIRLRGQIMDTRAQLDKKIRGTNKRRKKLLSKLDRLQTLLARRGPSLLEQATSLGTAESTSMEQAMIFQQYRESHSRSSRKEQTGDRILLAEDLRRRLEAEAAALSQDYEDCHLDGASFSSPAQRFLRAFNERFSRNPLTGPATAAVAKQGPSTTIQQTQSPVTRSSKDLLSDPTTNPLYHMDQLEICAVSDTHGFEGQFLNTDGGSDVLPVADILMHLGDFTLEGNAEVEAAAWKIMDEWLARQPHSIKIVVRGNHDPFQLSFPQSGALYVTEPTTIELTRSLTLGVVPYGSSRILSASKSLPKKCDIMASHVPPLKTLDRTLTGKSAGSGFLNKVVAPMKPQPKLWLCGHIHEGRGVAGRGPTTVINAANANRGKATHLDHGAVVVRVAKDDPVLVVQMDDKKLSSRPRPAPSTTFSSDTVPSPPENSLLLAVDLGLKSGVAMFSSSGKLLRYEQFLFHKDDIEASTKALIKEWEQSAIAGEFITKNDNPDSSPMRPRITHVAIEGGDSGLLRAWMDAVEDDTDDDGRPKIIWKVSPEEWRAELLVDKERISGAKAKEASRLIARQVVEDWGAMPRHQGKFPTDVAEAVCLGLYVSHKLGWIQRENPADGGAIVSRYTNGNIVVPLRR